MRIFIISLLLISGNLSQAVDRPPQFINLAFDGSKSTRMWQETTRFAQQHNIKFTYFISGVYFLSNQNRNSYQGPGRSAGRSDIGFGGTAEDIQIRNQWVEHAYRSGHEIASHANGHFNGSSWSAQSWLNELIQFENFLQAAPSQYGGFRQPRNWQRYVDRNLVGFRAPLLGKSSGMYQALQNQGYVYDTSRVEAATYWPRVVNGLWNFPLASLRMAYSNKRTLSMDYNMYVAQSGGSAGSSANYQQWENEVYETYLRYFKNNYIGNRAPIDIGHHFSLWNGGIYWRAMQRFAQTVCHLPEVVCGTYTELVHFLNRNNDKIASYQAGSFPRASVDQLPPSLQRISLHQKSDFYNETMTPELIEELESQVCPSEAHLEEDEFTTIIPDGIAI